MMLGIKIRWWLFCNDVGQWWHSGKCKRGWHKVTAEKVKVQTYKDGKWEIVYNDTFLKCQYCNWLFFPTKEQKEAYEKYRRREQEDNRRWAEAIVKGMKKNEN